ncbi:MAG: hypothetical protein JWP11_131 [Frankiales bacterium]|nr:hypothetical protein [Frankiales bacterium]
MLGQYLRDRGLGDWTYRTGRDPDGHTHAWLERDGTLLDITADQFHDGQPSVVLTTDPSWHSRFTPFGQPRPADLNFDGPAAGPLRADYAAAAALADT